jgi:bifunctional non-homologous end joining protein LigD
MTPITFNLLHRQRNADRCGLFLRARLFWAARGPPPALSRPASHPRGEAAGRTAWVHEIKHDGYRLQVRRAGDQVRLFTRRGYGWSGRYPAIAVTATLLRARWFTLDGEAVVCGPDGVAIFDALHRRGTVSEAMLYAFDLLELDGEDLRDMPLDDRKKRLARPLGERRLGTCSTPTRTAPRSSARPASWALRALCRSGLPRLTGRAPRGIGSRCRTRTAPR